MCSTWPENRKSPQHLVGLIEHDHPSIHPSIHSPILPFTPSSFQVSIYASISIHPSFHFNHPSIHPSIQQSISIYLSILPITYQHTCALIHPHFFPSIRFFMHAAIHLLLIFMQANLKLHTPAIIFNLLPCAS